MDNASSIWSGKPPLPREGYRLTDATGGNAGSWIARVERGGDRDEVDVIAGFGYWMEVVPFI